jgi:hypothetical protein
MLTEEDLYESMHWRELDLRDKLDSRLQLPLTLGTSIVGAVVFLLSNVEIKRTSGTENYIFFSLLVLTLISLAAGAYYFFHSSVGSFSKRNTYINIPTSDALLRYGNDLNEYYKRNLALTAGRAPEDVAADEVRKFLITKYIKCQNENAKINDSRALHIARLHLTIVVATTFGAITFGFYYLNDLDKSKDHTPTDIKITHPIDVRWLSYDEHGETVTQCLPSQQFHMPSR